MLFMLLMLFHACFMLMFCVVLWYACMYVGYVWEGLKNVFLNAFPSCFTLILKGFSGLFWHYSPLDREEVIMYRGRALVGPQYCRVSSRDEKRERR